MGWKLDKEDRVLNSTRFGRIDGNCSSQWLGAVLKKCPELAPYIIEDTGEEIEQAKVEVVIVGDETMMVKPSGFNVTVNKKKATKKAAKK